MSGSFEFDLRATPKDATGYFYPRWDKAQRITVTADTKQEAMNKAAKVLGDCPRGRGWYWAFKVDNIKEVQA